MTTATPTGYGYSFGDYTLDAKRGSLMKDGAEVRLRPQSFAILVYLVERQGQLVTRDELMQAIWGDTVVTDGSLTQCLIDIRKAIGDRSREAIRTVPRRGYIFEQPVQEWEAPRTASPEAVAPPGNGAGVRFRTLRPIALPALFAVLLAVSYLWWAVTPTLPGGGAGHGPLAVTAPSVAVLPFVDMSEHGDQEYFSDGIAEEILNLLSGIPGLQVTARTSSFSFKGQPVDIPRIAQELKVAYVLEGSVRKSGNRIRVTAQLVDAGTGMHVWSETYDRESGDVLALQQDIAAAVAASFELTLAKRNNHPDDVSPEAHEEFLRARYFYNRRGPGDAARAADYFQAALEVAPRYGQAWTGLAATWLVRVADEGMDPTVGFAKMERAVMQALKYAPNDPETHVRAGQYYGWTGEPEKVAQHRELARELGPDNPLVLSWLAGMYLEEGRFDQAVTGLTRAAELDPLVTSYHNNLAAALLAAGRVEKAREEFVKALELSPNYGTHFDIQLLNVLQGRYEEALAAVERWQDGPERDQVLAMANFGLGRPAQGEAALLRLQSSEEADILFRVPQVLAWRGDSEEAFARIVTTLDDIEAANPEATGKLRSAWEELQLSPFLAPLHDDPRWQEIRERTQNGGRATVLVGQ